MMRGGRTALLIAGLTLTGCAAPKEVSIRPIADPAAKLAAGDLAAARGQLLLGNAGLALEAFRNIHRDRPGDPRALAGIADCYAAMARYDLAQTNYEAALALAPHDPVLLTGLAGVFQSEGDAIRAIALRHEAAAAATAVAVANPAPAPARASGRSSAMASAPVRIVAAATASAVGVATPAPAPAPARSTEIASAPVRPAAAATATAVAIANPAPAPAAAPARSSDMASAPVHIAAATATTGSVTVKLPPARPADVPATPSAPARPTLAEAPQPQLSSSITVALPPPRPAPPLPPKHEDEPRVAIAPSNEPRLVRLSRGEVALVTSDRPLWPRQSISRSLASTTVRWIPLRDSGARPNVQILNAARHQGLAGSARTVLLDRGWRRIAVGDAPATRATSVVYYPRNRSALGHSLAAQFGVSARQIDGDVLFLVLGRDATNLVGSQRRS